MDASELVLYIRRLETLGAEMHAHIAESRRAIEETKRVLADLAARNAAIKAEIETARRALRLALPGTPARHPRVGSVSALGGPENRPASAERPSATPASA
jgi:hypothetical protein